MWRLSNLILIVLCALTLTACDDYRSIERPKTQIIAVYMHQVDDYSVAYVKHDNQISIERLPSSKRAPTILIPDVNESDPMWYMCVGGYSKIDGSPIADTRCEVHIHSIDNVNGAGWDEGKFGSGKTQRIQ